LLPLTQVLVINADAISRIAKGLDDNAKFAQEELERNYYKVVEITLFYIMINTT
jgi:hypothetical protein